MDTLEIRLVGPTDADAVAALVTQLGYPTDGAGMARRLAALADRPEYATFVAEVAGQVVAVAGVCVGRSLAFDGAYGRLTAMAVDEAMRGRGVGTRLLAWIEAWLVAQGAGRLILTSATHRARAHAFYIRQGYEQTGVRFIKRFGPA